jgi:hypothetical protein
VRVLPLYRPSEAESADPSLFASNVQCAMAEAAGGLTLYNEFSIAQAISREQTHQELRIQNKKNKKKKKNA